VRLHKWSFDEERALVEFVGLALMDPKYGITSTTQWPAFRPSHNFWADTARHIQTSTCSSVILTSEYMPKNSIPGIMVVEKNSNNKCPLFTLGK